MSAKQDTEALLGRMLNHDDSLDDRSPGSAQQDAYIRTRQLWLEDYHEHFAVAGAMYRGEPSHGLLPGIGQGPDGKPGKVELQLVSGQFGPCMMPEHIQQLWGPVPLPKLPAGTDNECIAATHRFVHFYQLCSVVKN